MQFSELSKKLTGVLIPVFSLRTGDSAGTGEFLDLLPFGRWCKSAGIQVIQLLPVNDSGDDPSPYSALSAFALHPLFVRIQALPEYGVLGPTSPTIKKVKQLQKAHQDELRLDYRNVLQEKLAILREIYDTQKDQISSDEGFKGWMKKNPWVQEYSVFRALKHQHQMTSWTTWKEFNQPTLADIDKLWKRKTLDAPFYAWIQYRLEQQFLQVARSLKEMGIILKGDIPILMNEDSADVWAHRDIFHFDLRAGAPPDMFSEEGQNWGFPVYNWEALEAQNYQWWRKRLLQADKFYQAYRIDHVLGFFRIWTIPYKNNSGILGYFNPSSYIHRADLYRKGFDDGRIRWLTEPHVSGSEIRNIFGLQGNKLISTIFQQIGNEDLFLFREDFGGERAINQLDVSPEVKNSLLVWYRDRTFVQVSEHEFSPTWTYGNCSRFQMLSDHERYSIEELVGQKGWENEDLWTLVGKKLLGFMIDTVGMLTCAEDLGAVPDCVPKTLAELKILGLKIPRWARTWSAPGQPYIPVVDYPFLSVCAPSVHDTSTLRDWWEHEDGQEGFWYALGLDGHCPKEYSPETAKKVLLHLQKAGSALCVYQLQDLFALVPELRIANSKDERVNIPGTVQDANWSYRIPFTVEALENLDGFTKVVKEIASAR
jgi:4-alpha-glucanotransferase